MKYKVEIYKNKQWIEKTSHLNFDNAKIWHDQWQKKGSKVRITYRGNVVTEEVKKKQILEHEGT